VTPLPVPWDFTDGVFPAYWRRPAAYLDPRTDECSALVQADQTAVERGVRRLRADLDSGWHERHRQLLDEDEWDAGFRLVVHERLPGSRRRGLAGRRASPYRRPQAPWWPTGRHSGTYPPDSRTPT
jgi:hypothetical protein